MLIISDHTHVLLYLETFQTLLSWIPQLEPQQITTVQPLMVIHFHLEKVADVTGEGHITQQVQEEQNAT